MEHQTLLYTLKFYLTPLPLLHILTQSPPFCHFIQFLNVGTNVRVRTALLPVPIEKPGAPHKSGPFETRDRRDSVAPLVPC